MDSMGKEMTAVKFGPDNSELSVNQKGNNTAEAYSSDEELQEHEASFQEAEPHESRAQMNENAETEAEIEDVGML